MKNNKVYLFIANVLTVFLIIYLLIQYSKSVNYTKIMFVSYSDNNKTILQDELTNKTITIDETNKSKYLRCEVTFNDNGTDWTQDDVIIKIEWIK